MGGRQHDNDAGAHPVLGWFSEGIFFSLLLWVYLRLGFLASIVMMLVVGSLDRADVYDAADRAQARLGMQVNPVIRTPEQWADDADSSILQIKASPTVDVTPAQKAAS